MGALDSAVPEYKTARAGLRGCSGAEDALMRAPVCARAGQVPEAQAAFASSQPRKKAFAVGWHRQWSISSGARGDGYGVVKQTFWRTRTRARWPKWRWVRPRPRNLESLPGRLRSIMPGPATTPSKEQFHHRQTVLAMMAPLALWD